MIWSAVALVALAALLCVTILPGLAERSFNRRTGERLPAVSPAAEDLHRSLLVADLHADTLLWNRSLLRRASRGHVDLPRLREGNVSLQVFSAVIKTPRGQNYDSNSGGTDALKPLLIAQLWPPAAWSGLEARAVYQAERLRRAAQRSRGDLVLVSSRRDLDAFLARRDEGSRAVAGLLAIEGLQALEGDIAAVDRLYGEGYRMMGLTHFYDNEVGGSAHGVERGGLTSFGRRVVHRMEELGIVVDLAHASPGLISAVLAEVERPVVVSHTGVQATCPGSRNLSDAQIRAIAANGGVMGVGYWDGAVCRATPVAIVAAMRHIRDLVGVEHVALGSDYDGATAVSFDTSQLAVLTDALLVEGFAAEEISAIMGRNVVNLLLDVLPEDG